MSVTGPVGDLDQFQQALGAIGAFSTVGIMTLSGVSPKGAALGELGHNLGNLPDAASQLQALDAVLAEAHTLWPDQEAQVIASLLRDLVQGQIVLAPDARDAGLDRLLQAAMPVVPLLQEDGAVADSLAFEVLNSFVFLAQMRHEFTISPATRKALEQAGFHLPGSPPQPGTPALQEAQEIGAALKGFAETSLDPAAFSQILGRIAPLPAALRARMLALLAALTWNTSRDPGNAPHVATLNQLIQQLPPQHRLTPLEAYYNQINLLPADRAKAFSSFVVASMQALPPGNEPRFARAHHDLTATVLRQQELLGTLDYKPGESLAERYQRDPSGF